MSKKPVGSVIDLDTAELGTTIVVRYRGVLTPVTRERLLELLEREEDALQQAISSGKTRATDAERISPRPSPQPTSVLEDGPISHASLSTRIKKIYNYSVATKHVRPTHAGLLSEVLAAFDWEIPEHPNTQLEHHLAEILRWKGVSDEQRHAIERFLRQYESARARATA